jgi:hypothetical protein
VVVSQVIRRTTRGHRENLGVVFARLVGAATVLLGVLVAFSIVAPSVRALWWTQTSRQEQMLVSYDAVLTAIQRALSRSGATQLPNQEHAA